MFCIFNSLGDPLRKFLTECLKALEYEVYGYNLIEQKQENPALNLPKCKENTQRQFSFTRARIRAENPSKWL